MPLAIRLMVVVRSFLGTITSFALFVYFQDFVLLTFFAGISACEGARFISERTHRLSLQVEYLCELEKDTRVRFKMWRFVMSSRQTLAVAALIFFVPVMQNIGIAVFDLGGQAAWKNRFQFYVFALQGDVISAGASAFLPLWLVSSRNFRQQVSDLPFFLTDLVLPFFPKRIRFSAQLIFVCFNCLLFVSGAWLVLWFVLTGVWTSGMKSGAEMIVLIGCIAFFSLFISSFVMVVRRMYLFVRIRMECPRELGEW